MSGKRLRLGLYPLAILIVGFGLVTQAGVQLWQMRDATWAASAESGRNLHRTLRERLGDIFSRRDETLRDIIDVIHLPGIADLAPETRQRLFFGRPIDERDGSGAIIINAEGHSIANAYGPAAVPSDLSQRAYFRAHRDNPTLGLFIGDPIMTFRSRAWSIPISRRVSAPDGGFAGVVVAFVKVEEISRLFADIELGGGGVIALFRSDGAVLARMPPLPSQGVNPSFGPAAVAIAGHGASEPFISNSLIDGNRRYYTPGEVPGFPLILHVGRDIAAIEGAWHHRATLVAAALLTCIGLLVIATCLVEREMGRRRRSEAALAVSEARYRAILHHASDAIVTIERHGRAAYVSPATQRLLGIAPEHLLGRRLLFQALPESRPHLLQAFRRLRDGFNETSLRFRARHADGRILWLETVLARTPDGAVAMTRDVTVKHDQEADLARLAYQDSLTGLGNRRCFDLALAKAWREGTENGESVAVLLLDIDHFKQINDTHGHQVGDAALRLVAAKLTALLRRSSDLAVRLGGDELALLLPRTDRRSALRLAERIRKALVSRSRTEESTVPYITASIGVAAIVPKPGPVEATALLAAADAALYSAKMAGRDRVAA